MKSLRNSINENIVNEAMVGVNCIKNPNNVKYDLTPGLYDEEFTGIIIGKPFKYDDINGNTVALELVKKIGLELGNEYDDIVKDIENKYGSFINSTWFAYFLNNENYKVDCYVFGRDGLCALM